MKFVSARIQDKPNDKGIFSIEFTHEDGAKSIYKPDELIHIQGEQFKTAQEVFEVFIKENQA